MTTTHERDQPTTTDFAERAFGPLSRTDFVRYAGAGGDFNPIHHDEPFATSSGYPSVFAHGLLTGGILSTFVTAWLGREHLRRFSVRYVDQVWPGDTLVTRGEVVGLVPSTPDVSGAEVEVHARLTVHAQAPDSGASRLVLTGEAVGRYSPGEPHPGRVAEKPA